MTVKNIKTLAVTIAAGKVWVTKGLPLCVRDLLRLQMDPSAKTDLQCLQAVVLKPLPYSGGVQEPQSQGEAMAYVFCLYGEMLKETFS